MKKARVAVPVTRLTLQASRIALPVETSNAEAHADMYITPPQYTLSQKRIQLWLSVYNIPMDIYRC